MKTSIESQLIGMAIGIQFRANFAIEDEIGKIVDDILYSEDSYFNPNVFPIVRNNLDGKILFNDENDYLLINNKNILMDITFGKVFSKKDYGEICEKFKSLFISTIVKKYKIKKIGRIGLVKRYLFQEEELAKDFVKKIIGESYDGVNDISLSFSKKIPVVNSFLHKDINDYDNAIFNFNKHADKNELFVAVDYQKYFSPPLESGGGISFDGFLQRAENFSVKNTLAWIEPTYLKAK